MYIVYFLLVLVLQVHKGHMYANMVPDESIIEEMSDDSDEDQLEIDFAEGKMKPDNHNIITCIFRVFRLQLLKR